MLKIFFLQRYHLFNRCQTRSVAFPVRFLSSAVNCSALDLIKQSDKRELEVMLLNLVTKGFFLFSNFLIFC